MERYTQNTFLGGIFTVVTNLRKLFRGLRCENQVITTIHFALTALKHTQFHDVVKGLRLSYRGRSDISQTILECLERLNLNASVPKKQVMV